jgi:hypothetical protein
MLPGSLIQTKARLSLKNKAFIKENIRNKAVDSDTGSPAGTATPDSPAATGSPAGTATPDSPAADSAVDNSIAPAIAADSNASASAAVQVPQVYPMRTNPAPKVDTAKSACTVLPPACASGYHSDSNGDCVSDVSIPEIFNNGEKFC